MRGLSSGCCSGTDGGSLGDVGVDPFGARAPTHDDGRSVRGAGATPGPAVCAPGVTIPGPAATPTRHRQLPFPHGTLAHGLFSARLRVESTSNRCKVRRKTTWGAVGGGRACDLWWLDDQRAARPASATSMSWW